jgi:DNA-binding response OmpR family regulator
MRILLIEDNSDLAASVGEYLEAREHKVDYAQDGAAGLHLACTEPYDVVVLDLGLPTMDGVEVCRRLRGNAQMHVPVLILTARDTLDDKIEGFDAGADDYLVKPFSVRELEARLLALTRRTTALAGTRLLRVADLELNLDTLVVRRGDRALVLKPGGRKLLELLMRNSHRVVTRAEMEYELWGDDPPDADSLRVHVHTLRHEVDAENEQPLLHTVRGVGYRLGDSA